LEGFATRLERLIVSCRLPQQRRRIRPVTPPIGAEFPVEVPDAVLVIIAKHQPAGHRCGSNLTEVESDRARRSNRGGTQFDFARGRPPGIGEVRPAFTRLADGRHGLLLMGRGDEQVSPVDPQVVPLFGQHRLFLRTTAKRREPGHLRPGPAHGLVRVIDREFLRRVEAGLHRVGFAIGRLELPGEISHRPRQQIKVIGQAGGHERQRQRHPGILECIDGPGRQHAQARLPHRRHLGGIGTHHPEGLAINPHQACQPVPPAGPVDGIRVG